MVGVVRLVSVRGLVEAVPLPRGSCVHDCRRPDDHPGQRRRPPDGRDRRLRILRWVAVAVWAVVVVYRTVTEGFAFNRELLLLYIATGLLAASIGQGRRMLYVIRDWLPFALVLSPTTSAGERPP